MPCVTCDQCRRYVAPELCVTRTNQDDGEVLRLCLPCDDPARGPFTFDETWCAYQRTLMHDWIVAHESLREPMSRTVSELFAEAMDMAAVTLARSAR